jgi:hypothetical protein
MILTSSQIHYLLKRFPNFELSYETILHKKCLDENYDLVLIIPLGIKAFLWFSFFIFKETKNVCFLMELNRDKKICKVSIIDIDFDESLSIGTIIYGTMIDNYFVIEDIFFYKGIELKILFSEKLGIIYNLFENKMFITNFITLSYMCWANKFNIHDFIKNKINIKYIQYRSLSKILPYLNIIYNKEIQCEQKINKQTYIVPFINIKKPQYKLSTIFKVIPDLQFDIYHLFANNDIYYNLAYIPNYKTSVFMNSLFRNIRENKNIDYIEESDDDDDFQNVNLDKYVDLNKKILMECVFSFKFKKWIPIKIVKNLNIVNIKNLI